MMYLDCSDISFGPKSYHENSGIKFILGFYLFASIALSLGGAALYSRAPWTAYGCYALAALLFLRFLKLMQWPSWRKHHYSLQKLHLAAYAAIAGSVVNSSKGIGFEEVARPFLKMAFPRIGADSIEKLIQRTKAPYWDVLVETGVVRKGIPPTDPGLKQLKESMESAQKRQPDFYRNVFLFAMIIGAHEGREIIPVYIYGRASDRLPRLF